MHTHNTVPPVHTELGFKAKKSNVFLWCYGVGTVMPWPVQPL